MCALTSRANFFAARRRLPESSVPLDRNVASAAIIACANGIDVCAGRRRAPGVRSSSSAWRSASSSGRTRCLRASSVMRSRRASSSFEFVRCRKSDRRDSAAVRAPFRRDASVRCRAVRVRSASVAWPSSIPASTVATRATSATPASESPSSTVKRGADPRLGILRFRQASIAVVQIFVFARHDCQLGEFAELIFQQSSSVARLFGGGFERMQVIRGAAPDAIRVAHAAPRALRRLRSDRADRVVLRAAAATDVRSGHGCRSASLRVPPDRSTSPARR